TTAGAALPGLDYTFQVSTVDPRAMPRTDPEPGRLPDPPAPSVWWNEPAPSATAAVGLCDTLLPNFPTISLVNANQQLPGVYFLAPFNNGVQTQARLQIMDDRGKSLYQRVYDNNSLPADFKIQKNGHLTFWLNNSFKFYEMDSSYAVVD